MWTLFKLVFILAVLAALGVVGYAYVGDLSPDLQDVSEPVILDAE